MTDKAKVVYMYPNAVAEYTCDVCDENNNMIYLIWSAPKDIGTTRKSRYLLGLGANESQAWYNARIGVDQVCSLMRAIAPEWSQT